MIDRATSAIGHVTALEKRLTSDKTLSTMATKTVPFVARQLEGLPHRVIKSYALMLTTIEMVRKHCIILVYDKLDHNIIRRFVN